MIVYDLVNYVIPSNIPKWYLHISFPLYPNCGSEPTKARLWLLQFAGVLAVAGWTHVLVDNGLAKADESDLKKLDRCARLLRQIVRYMLNLKSWGIPDPLWSPWLFQFCYNIIIYIYIHIVTHGIRTWLIWGTRSLGKLHLWLKDVERLLSSKIAD